MTNPEKQIQNKDFKTLARYISLVENEADGYVELLQSLPAVTSTPVIGITGAPGAGKSTLADALIQVWVKQGKKVAVLCVDPSSPFNKGALLGDRIRMSEWYTHPQVYIRSLASRGSLGGLHAQILEITALLQVFGFDYIIVETVGVGQSEVEIAGLADLTIVVLVPEGGDEVQTMKAGLMEIADIFVVNKSDRPAADLFVQNLLTMMGPAFAHSATPPPVLKTIASQKEGIAELVAEITGRLGKTSHKDRKDWLLTERAYHLIQRQRMKNVDKEDLRRGIEIAKENGDFNLYQFVQKY
jgi:LAO/AO transport system kinase